MLYGAPESFFTKIAGITHNHRQEFIKFFTEGQELIAVRQPENEFDRNAIAVFDGIRQLGYIPKGVAEQIAPKMDFGSCVTIHVACITGIDQPYQGVNIKVSIYPENYHHVVSDSYKHMRQKYLDDASQEMLAKQAREEYEIQRNKQNFSDWLSKNFHG